MDYTSTCSVTTDASSTISVNCYNPLDAQFFFINDFLFFVICLTAVVIGIKKIFNL